jgi:hypothetical protein
MTANFEDSETLYERAQKRISDYRNVLKPVWKITKTNVGLGEWSYALLLDRPLLGRLKLVVADIAGDLAHALDHVVAAACRIGNVSRNTKTHFPAAMDDADFAAQCKGLASIVGSDWTNLFATVRSQHFGIGAHLKLVKEVANASKHWELIACDAAALAVAWNLPGQPQTIVQIPSDHFKSVEKFEFWRGGELNAVRFMFVQSIRFDGIEVEGLKADPDTSFGVVSRFVRAVIDASKAHASTIA